MFEVGCVIQSVTSDLLSANIVATTDMHSKDHLVVFHKNVKISEMPVIGLVYDLAAADSPDSNFSE